MAAVVFTHREMIRAWKANLSASRHSKCTNAHRLLLFYAVECGLKAVLMKRQSVTCTNHCPEISEAQHNINKLLDALSAGQALKLPNHFKMAPINDKRSKLDRKLNPGQINQMWRYGGKVENSLTDETLEKNLIKISEWIKQELG